ncbi:DUF4113 domain-containing protein [Serratia plymuthica]|nr:DUF4113 domain-containing protein [Serratia plymuthica]QQT80949.1 DUF4113 domain-containing protein [Serratia plymuthica]
MIHITAIVFYWFAGQGINKAWAMRRELLSPAYTTRWNDIPVARLA